MKRFLRALVFPTVILALLGGGGYFVWWVWENYRPGDDRAIAKREGADEASRKPQDAPGDEESRGDESAGDDAAGEKPASDEAVGARSAGDETAGDEAEPAPDDVEVPADTDSPADAAGPSSVLAPDSQETVESPRAADPSDEQPDGFEVGDTPANAEAEPGNAVDETGDEAVADDEEESEDVDEMESDDEADSWDSPAAVDGAAHVTAYVDLPDFALGEAAYERIPLAEGNLEVTGATRLHGLEEVNRLLEESSRELAAVQFPPGAGDLVVVLRPVVQPSATGPPIAPWHVDVATFELTGGEVWFRWHELPEEYSDELSTCEWLRACVLELNRGDASSFVALARPQDEPALRLAEGRCDFVLARTTPPVGRFELVVGGANLKRDDGRLFYYGELADALAAEPLAQLAAELGARELAVRTQRTPDGGWQVLVAARPRPLDTEKESRLEELRSERGTILRHLAVVRQEDTPIVARVFDAQALVELLEMPNPPRPPQATDASATNEWRKYSRQVAARLVPFAESRSRRLLREIRKIKEELAPEETLESHRLAIEVGRMQEMSATLCRVVDGLMVDVARFGY